MKKLRLFLMLLCFSLFAISLAACGNSDTTTAKKTEETTAPTSSVPTTTGQFSLEKVSPVLPKPEQPQKVYVLTKPQNNNTLLSAVSLQGLLAKGNKDRIFISYDTSATNSLNMLKRYYKEDCKFQNLPGIWVYLKENPGIIDGYILTDLGDESVNVATSLSGLLNAVIVTKANQSSAENAGLTCLLDATDKNDLWLRLSDYFDKLNKNIAFMLSPNGIEFLRDYAIYNNAYLFSDADTSANGLRGHLTHMNPGFTVLGWNNNLGEHGTVQTISLLNGCMIPSDYAKNLATTASFPLSDAHQKTNLKESTLDKKHTLCLVMSDGDNLQWVLNDFQTSTKWFANKQRGTFRFAWGLPASLIDLSPSALMYFYKNMKPNEEFIMELSGLGYTFPSKWTDMEALANMQSKVVESMKRGNMSVLEILDDVTLSQKTVDTYYKGYLTDDEIKGILYIDYGNYAKYKGAIFWTNGKPIVTARYRLWADTEYSIEAMADAINNASIDPQNQNSYTFVTVHAWSGIDSAGNFVNGGNSYDAVAKLVSLLDDDVELVTPTEFVERIAENIKH